jgi:ribonuclease HII
MLPLAPDGFAAPPARMASIDEVGRGAGCLPVVAAAVVWSYDPATPAERKLMDGIRDSKHLSARKRGRMAEFIREKADAFGVGECSSAEIDEINILRATQLAMRRALDALAVPVDGVLVDGNYFEGWRDTPFRCEVKGDDRFFGIACASIIAKVHRDDLCVSAAERHPEYGWQRNKGYITPEHIAALREHGATPEHRLTFVRKFTQ